MAQRDGRAWSRKTPSQTGLRASSSSEVSVACPHHEPSTCGAAHIRRADRRYQLAQVVVHDNRFCGLLGRRVELAALAHEIVVGVNDQQGGAVGDVGGRCNIHVHWVSPNLGLTVMSRGCLPTSV